ncbi:MAG: Gfo/Idh/MocA family oxidoreductase [Planctomycetaceae bacterium]|nr:Gfo/Idh/MocA family oxidoreductase [Planctomycetaceae bacterium]
MLNKKNYVSRRCFLAGSLAGLTVSPLVIPGSVLGKDGSIPPSDRITIGMIGVGGKGNHAIQTMKPLPDHQIVAVCDCRRDRAVRAHDIVNQMYAERASKGSYKGCTLYDDFRDILIRDDIDAVWGTINDHWHGPMFSRMVKAGKDVYGEKVLTRYIGQGISLCKQVREYGVVFQTGTQQRSQKIFRQACELARNGYLGKVHTIEVAVPRGQAYSCVPPSEPPAGFNWDMWSGPAPLIPFDERRVSYPCLYMISHYCAGFVTNWGVHHLDIAGWGMPEVFEKPFEIEGKGVMPSEGMTDTWVTWRASFRYESGLHLDFSSTGDPHPQGCRFVGDKGWVHVNRAGIKSEPASLLDVKLKDSDIMLHRSPGFADPSTAHIADFFRSIRTRQDPASPVEAGHLATTLGNVCDIAMRMRRKLKWNPQESCFVGDDAANRMLTVAERSPWTMET